MSEPARAIDASPRLDAALAERGIRLDAEVGRGASAVVYRAYDERHGRLVAVKVLRESVGATLGARRFAAEIRLAARLQHPKIVPLYDSGAVGDTPFYVMPFVAGESLRARLNRVGRLPLTEAVRLAREVADALAYAHAQGIVHRDVKPANILLEAGHAVVTDFGVALALSRVLERHADGTAYGMIVGTPAYLSPEQAAGEPVDGRSDVYSLACVLYEALVGRPPFTAPSTRAVIAQRFLRPPPRLRVARRDAPRSLERALLRGLAPEPSARFPDAAAFASALERALAPARSAGPGRTLLAAGVVLPAIAWGLLAGRSPTPLPGPTRVVVQPFANRTGDTALTPLGQLAADLIATDVARDARLDVATGSAGAARGTRSGAAIVVTGSYYRTGRAVEMLARVTDVGTGELLRTLGPVRAPAPAGERLDRELARGVLTVLDSLARVAADSAAVRLLPLHEVPAGADGDAVAVLLTGAGGWTSFDRALAGALAARGTAVVALEMRTYLAPGRSPTETAADVERVMRAYRARWRRPRVALVGFGRGASVLPFVATRVPVDVRRTLTLLALLDRGPRANFRFRWVDLVRDVRRVDDLPTLPEIESLAGAPLLCVYRTAEPSSPCRDAPPGLLRVVAAPNGHDADGAPRALGDLVADAIAR